MSQAMHPCGHLVCWNAVAKKGRVRATVGGELCQYVVLEQCFDLDDPYTLNDLERAVNRVWCPVALEISNAQDSGTICKFSYIFVPWDSEPLDHCHGATTICKTSHAKEKELHLHLQSISTKGPYIFKKAVGAMAHAEAD